MLSMPEKFRLNRNPHYCTVPTLESVDGKGKIIYDAMLPNGSSLYIGKNVLDFPGMMLSEFDDDAISETSTRFGIPEEELMELRRKEREFEC